MCSYLRDTTLVAASGDGELAGDGREYALDLIAQRNQDRDGDHGNEGENQGVLNESLAFLALHPAQCGFGAGNNFIDHYLFTSFDSEKRSGAHPLVMENAPSLLRENFMVKSGRFYR